MHRQANPRPSATRTTVPVKNAPPGQSRTPVPGTIIRSLTRPPQVGTLIQRLSGNQARKLAALMATPLPPRHQKRPTRPIRPIRPIQPASTKDRLTELFGDPLSDVSDNEQTEHAAPTTSTTRSPATSTCPDQVSPQPEPPTADNARPTATTPVYGPSTPPPIDISVGHGIVVSVPHFAVHISRRYKARVGERRFMLRFDHNGRCRYHREIQSTAGQA